MNRVRWRWAERDFGFRFRLGSGRATAEYYQANEAGAFYCVPAQHRKLAKEHIDELALAVAPTAPRIVPIPWRDYDREWDWIETADGILLNFAGCLDREEIHRREDEGVARAMELVASYLDRPDAAPLSSSLVQQIHVELMGAIYPFAGAWRTVSLHKGEGAVKWPFPPGGIGPQMDILERDVFSRSPFLSEDDSQVFEFVSEVMGELIAVHPFREGNGRVAFIAGNLVLMQNNFLPLDVYDRLVDQERYFAACEDVRIHKNYTQLASLVAEWAAAARARWEASNGQ